MSGAPDPASRCPPLESEDTQQGACGNPFPVSVAGPPGFSSQLEA
jgi:hypothetical protein